MGYPDEYFLPHALESRGWPPNDPARYIRQIFDEATSPNGVGGAKVMWGDFERLASDLRCDRVKTITHIFPPLQFIWVTRRDKVRQALSLAKAVQSGVWRVVCGQGPPSSGLEPRLRPGEVDQYVDMLKKHDANWEQFFASLGVKPFKVDYEYLAAQYDEALKGVAAVLGVALTSFQASRLEKQSNISSEEWLAQYRERNI